MPRPPGFRALWRSSSVGASAERSVCTEAFSADARAACAESKFQDLDVSAKSAKHCKQERRQELKPPGLDVNVAHGRLCRQPMSWPTVRGSLEKPTC